MFFTDRDKATNMEASQTLLDASHTTELQRKRSLARKPILLSLQTLTRLQEIAGSKKFSVTRGRELVSKKVAEVLGTELSTVLSILKFMIERNYRYDRCADNSFKRNRYYWKLKRKIITEKVLLKATTLFTKWLEAGLIIVSLTKGSRELTNRLVRTLQTE